MSDIFISFAREDRAAAKTLAESLMQFGWSVWWDTLLLPGQHFGEVIERALEEARWVIVLWSKSSITSDWVIEEASYARERFTLLPVMIDSVRLPLGFRSIQTLDLTDWHGEQSHSGFQRLVEEISASFQEMPTSRELAAEASLRGSSLISVNPGSVFRDVDAPWCPEMTVLPAGVFIMGSPDSDNEADSSEKPQHQVVIGYPFAVGRYLVTFDEYDYFVNATGRAVPNDEGWGRGQRPVINISWLDAKAYVSWLSQMTGSEYDLLSEAEWEYACRAGTTTRYWWGDAVTEHNANFGSIVGKTTTVGTYPPNPWGLFDMHGNIWEWVVDVWHEDYSGAPVNGVAWAEGSDRDIRVSRGGSWINAIGDLRSACRDPNSINNRGGSLGFRVARRL